MHSTNTHFTEWFHTCPNCMQPLEVQPYLVKCQSCGFIDYLNPAPCVTLIITRGETMLFGRRAIEPHKGVWDLPGGFITPGESPLDAAKREILEETGLTLQNIKQFGEAVPDLYENRPTLCIFYTADSPSGDFSAQDDVSELKWIPITELPLEDMPFESIKVTLNEWLNARGKVH